MTRRRRLRRRLLWAGVLMGLLLLVATVSVLRAGIWARDALTSTSNKPYTEGRERAMFAKTSLAIVAVLGALLLAVPASADTRGANRLNSVHATGSAAATSEPAWARALRLRSEALNRQYGLGTWERRVSPAPQGNEPTWLRALRLRSEALNQQYKLGEHAPGS